MASLRQLLAWGLFPFVTAFVARPAAGEETVFLDGLAVVTGTAQRDESDATPVLTSDLDFEAALFLLSTAKEGTPSVQKDPSVRQRARRVAVLTRLLAHQARQLAESTDRAAARELKREIIRRAGGPQAMRRILAEHGRSDAALTEWARRTALAAQQISSFKDQRVVSALSRSGEAEKDAKIKEDEFMMRAVAEWIRGLLHASPPRIVR